MVLKKALSVMSAAALAASMFAISSSAEAIEKDVALSKPGMSAQAKLILRAETAKVEEESPLMQEGGWEKINKLEATVRVSDAYAKSGEWYGGAFGVNVKRTGDTPFDHSWTDLGSFDNSSLESIGNNLYKITYAAPEGKTLWEDGGYGIEGIGDDPCIQIWVDHYQVKETEFPNIDQKDFAVMNISAYEGDTLIISANNTTPAPLDPVDDNSSSTTDSTTSSATDSKSDSKTDSTTSSATDSKTDSSKTDSKTDTSKPAAKQSIAKAKVTVKKQTYNGKAKKPAVTVKLGSKTLKKGTDYTVSYKNNKKIGAAAVVVTGKGAYTGKVTKTFQIVPGKTTIKSVKAAKKAAKVTVKKVKGAGGYQVKAATTKKFKKATSVNSKKVTATVKKLKSGKKYFVKARAFKKVGKKTYYGAFSKMKSVKVK